MNLYTFTDFILCSKFNQIKLFLLCFLISLNLSAQPSFSELNILQQKYIGYNWYNIENVSIKNGADRLDLYKDLINNKNIGLVVNHTSVIEVLDSSFSGSTYSKVFKKDVHLVDSLIGLGFAVNKIFSPEHGFQGSADAGAYIENNKYRDIPVISLYGNKKKPNIEDLQGIEIMIFDIQDVGVRYYTYISTLHYIMEACAEHDIPLIVLDRYNPNRRYIDGPVLKSDYKSFIGMHPVPIVYGMTIGEYALMINGEKWLNDNLECDLKVIKIGGDYNDFKSSLFYDTPNASWSGVWIHKTEYTKEKITKKDRYEDYYDNKKEWLTVKICHNWRDVCDGSCCEIYTTNKYSIADYTYDNDVTVLELDTTATEYVERFTCRCNHYCENPDNETQDSVWVTYTVEGFSHDDLTNALGNGAPEVYTDTVVGTYAISDTDLVYLNGGYEFVEIIKIEPVSPEYLERFICTCNYDCEKPAKPIFPFMFEKKLRIPPSPNLPNYLAISLYPSLCLFEGTSVSVGRGTGKPFQHFGSPYFPSTSYMFVPKSTYGSKSPKHINKICWGYSTEELLETFNTKGDLLILDWLINAYHSYQITDEHDKFFNISFFDKLAGSSSLRKQIELGYTETQIRDSWQEDLNIFKEIRAKYILYD